MITSARLGLNPDQQAFVDCWDGTTEGTAKRVGITTQQASQWQRTNWFIKGIAKRTERERKLAIYSRIDQLEGQIADRMSIQQFWTSTMVDPRESTQQRLKASELLAKSLGEFIERVELSGDKENPVCVRHSDLEERIKLLALAPIRVQHEWLE